MPSLRDKLAAIAEAVVEKKEKKDIKVEVKKKKKSKK